MVVLSNPNPKVRRAITLAKAGGSGKVNLCYWNSISVYPFSPNVKGVGNIRRIVVNCDSCSITLTNLQLLF